MRLILLFLFTSTWILIMSLKNQSKIPEEAKEFASLFHADFIFVSSSVDLPFHKFTMKATRISESSDNLTVLLSHLDKKNKVLLSEVDQFDYSHNSYYIRFLFYVDVSGFTNEKFTNQTCEIPLTRSKGSNFIGQRVSCSKDSKMSDKKYIAVNCTHYYQSGENYSYLFRIENRVALPEEWRPMNPPCPL